MKNTLTIEQRFALQRARYETSRTSKPALEKTVVRLLKTRMEQKNGLQTFLRENGILFKVDEAQVGPPEIMSEETFTELLILNSIDEMSTDIEDIGWEDDDLDGDGLTFA